LEKGVRGIRRKGTGYGEERKTPTPKTSQNYRRKLKVKTRKAEQKKVKTPKGVPPIPLYPHTLIPLKVFLALTTLIALYRGETEIALGAIGALLSLWEKGYGVRGRRKGYEEWGIVDGEEKKIFLLSLPPNIKA
jgi:hypothetical protein